MSAAELLARGRAFAAELRAEAETCTIRRKTGTTLGAGGHVTPTYAVLYEGPCRVQQRQAQATEERPGEAHVLMLPLEVQLPMTVVGLRAEDVITIDTSALDPDLPGREFVIQGLAHKAHATQRRVQVMERTS